MLFLPPLLSWASSISCCYLQGSWVGFDTLLSSGQWPLLFIRILKKPLSYRLELTKHPGPHPCSAWHKKRYFLFTFVSCVSSLAAVMKSCVDNFCLIGGFHNAFIAGGFCSNTSRMFRGLCLRWAVLTSWNLFLLCIWYRTMACSGCYTAPSSGHYILLDSFNFLDSYLAAIWLQSWVKMPQHVSTVDQLRYFESFDWQVTILTWLSEQFFRAPVFVNPFQLWPSQRQTIDLSVLTSFIAADAHGR